MNARCLSRGKESQVFAVSLTISTGTCSRQRATVRRYRTLTRHLVYPANRRDRGLSAYEILPLWADVPARPALGVVPLAYSMSSAGIWRCVCLILARRETMQ